MLVLHAHTSYLIRETRAHVTVSFNCALCTALNDCAWQCVQVAQLKAGMAHAAQPSGSDQARHSAASPAPLPTSTAPAGASSVAAAGRPDTGLVSEADRSVTMWSQLINCHVQMCKWCQVQLRRRGHMQMLCSITSAAAISIPCIRESPSVHSSHLLHFRSTQTQA